MYRNLWLCLLVVAVVISLPYFILVINPVTSEWGEYWQVRAYLVSYTGYITMMLMSLTVILSVRHWPLERRLRGLDQQYRLHKYMGISAVFFAFFHWFVFLSDDIFMALNLVAYTEERYPFWKLLTLLGEPAQLIGEWGFYIASLLVIIAWFRYFPHRIFEKTHQIFPYLYLILVLHVIVFFETSLWLTIPGVLLGVVVALASIGCILTILNLNGKKKRGFAVIEEVATISSGIEVKLKPHDSVSQDLMKNYRPGQFVFVSFDKSERAHPFSLASVQASNGAISLLIKANGDYTNDLSNKLNPGQLTQIEGPYGCFDFEDLSKHQLWVAGGIGIAPFLSGLPSVPSSRTIDLIYSYNEPDQIIIKKLESLSKPANIKLHLIDTSKMKRMNPELILAKLADPKTSSIWFCGPTSLGERLERILAKNGFKSAQFHRELFEFR